MRPWIEFEGPPTLGFYQGWAPAGATLPALSYPLLAELGKLRRPLSPDGELANLPIAFDNTSGGTYALLERVRGKLASVKAVINGTVVTLFRGELEDLPRGDQRLSGNLVGQNLTEPAPLRDATILDNFREATKIPRVFGKEVTLKPMALNEDNTEYLIADASIHRIVKVFDGVRSLPPTSFALHNRTDGHGHPIAVLLLSKSPDEEISVTVDGERDPDDGTLLSNPGDIVWQILAHIAKLDVNRTDIDLLRVETLGVHLRGVVDGSHRSVHELVNEIMLSAGALWSPGAQGYGRRWPPQRRGSDPIRGVLDKVSGWDVVSEPQDRYTKVNVKWGFDWAANDYNHGLVIEAPVIARELTERTFDLELKWVGSEGLAEEIGLRWARYLGASRWRVTWTSGRAAVTLQPGSWYTLNHPHSELSGEQPLIESAVDLQTGVVDMTAEGYRGALPYVEITQRSQREIALETRTISVREAGAAQQVIQVTDRFGNLISGAAVTVNGRIYITDNAGRATVVGLNRGESYRVEVRVPGQGTVIATLAVN